MCISVQVLYIDLCITLLGMCVYMCLICIEYHFMSTASNKILCNIDVLSPFSESTSVATRACVYLALVQSFITKIKGECLPI